MAAAATQHDTAIAAFMRQQAAADVLRFITCGSVDHGKSSLVGRILYEAQLVFEDQLSAVEQDSRNFGTVPEGIDYALLLDGLEAELEQGITIDVAYRYFATKGRRFILADAPGHEQYTRNMATAASTADLALIVVDASQGLLTQTRRHSFIFALFRVPLVTLAVTKMDLIGYNQKTFNDICEGYQAIARELGIAEVKCIPVSALKGDNVTVPSARMPWYKGPTLLDHLTSARPPDIAAAAPFRFPVQRAMRRDAAFRGYGGTIASGTIRRGDDVIVQPSGRATRIERVILSGKDVESAEAGLSITLTLADEVDVSRGDMLCAGDPPFVADQYAAHLLWMDETELLPGRSYLMKSGTRTARASISTLKHRVNVDTFEHQAATTLHLNEIGYITLTTDRVTPFDDYRKLRDTGAFILIDPFTNRTAGAGVVDFALRRATNISWQHIEIGRETHTALKHQRPCALWFTGLSGAGKSTIANQLEKRLASRGRHTYLLDGDNVRHGLNKDLGFTPEARVENVRRVGEVAKLFVDAGIIILVSLISPFRAERDMVRALLGDGHFIEIYVSAPIEECERRDPKGLYRRARAGEIPNFTGIDSPYEPPTAAELTLDTTRLTSEEAADLIVQFLERRSYI